MTSRQEAKLNMFRGTKQVCDDNMAIVTPVPAFLANYTTLKAKISALFTAITSEAQHVTGIATDKGTAKKNLCAIASDIADLVYSYATSIGNATLRDKVKYTTSDLIRMKDDQLAPICQVIYSAANSNSTPLGAYGISAAMLTSFLTAITDYSNAVPLPVAAKSARMTYTKNIEKQVKDIDTFLKEQMDRTISVFNITKPDFVASYFNARNIMDPSKTTTQLKGKVTDIESGNPLKGAQVSITGASTATLMTSRSGIFTFKPVPFGDYELTITLATYQTLVSDTFHVKQGQINTFNFALTAES